jgi:hypothetical protein
MVLVSQRGAKDGHDGIAQISIHFATQAMNNRLHGIEISLNQTVQALRTQASDQFCEARQIAEKRGDFAATFMSIGRITAAWLQWA